MSLFLLTALGSYGDVHPMVGLGGALAARGHQVCIFTNPYFEDVVTEAGLELVPLGTRDDYIRLSQHPHLWHPLRGPKMVLGYAASTLLRPLYDALLAHYEPGNTVFCAHSLDLASRLACEKLGAPLASVIFAPAVLWSEYDSPRLKGPLLGPGVPRWLKRLQFNASDYLFLRPLLGPHVNRLRAELGLKSVRDFSRWLVASDLVLGLFPEWFAPPQPDWPRQVRLVGFPHWDSHRDAQLPREVREFLAAGDRPVVFSPGSANRNAGTFFASAVAACERLACRGILLTKYDHQLPGKLPPGVRHFGFLPMTKLLPHAGALVHHGGVGSCAQGLLAGIPHLVQPMSYDQFDNARRLTRLGVAEEISVRRFRAPAIAASLTRLLHSPDVHGRCRKLAAHCDGSAALDRACAVLAELATPARLR